MAAVVVNQNNIVDIVKSTLDIMASISTVISNATLFCAHLKINIDVVDNAITQIFGDNGEGGVVGRVREINETLTNKRFYRSFMRNHIKKAISLQFNEIKDLIELIKEVADEAQGIDKGIINTIHYVMTSMVDIFDLTKKIPLNPLIGVRLEHAHLILYLIKIHILRPIRIIGLSFYRSYKNTLIGVAVLKLIAHVFMPCIADLVTAVNSVSILKYTTSLIGLSLIGANLKSMFKIITILGRKRLNPNNILKIAVISAMLKGVIQIMVDLVKSVPLIKTIVSLKLGVWETLGEILKQIFNIFSDISKRNYKYSTLMRITVLTTALTAVFKMLFYVVENMDTVKVIVDQGLEVWDAFETIVHKIFDIFGDISKRNYKYSTLARMAILMTTVTFVFSCLYKIMDGKSVIGTIISYTLKIWDKILGGTKKIFDIFHEISMHKYKFSTLLRMTILMSFMVIIFKALKIVMKAAMVAGLAAAVFNLTGLAIIVALETIFTIVKMIKKTTRLLNAKAVGGMLKLLLMLSLLGLIGVSLAVVTLVAIPVVMGLPYILLFLLSLIPIMLAMISISLIGLLFIALGPLALPGLTSLTFAIAALGIMAALLYAISKIELDYDQVMNVVETVVDTCRAIINRIFENSECDGLSVNESGSWFDMAKAIFTGAPAILDALAASTILVISLIGVISIVFIAGMLKVLQKTVETLDKPKVLEAIDSIVGICRFIRYAIFGNREYNEKSENIQKTGEGERNFLIRFISGIGDFISVIFGSVMLVSSLISIGALFFIANTLKSLEGIDFNIGTVNSKINEIMSGVKTVIAAVRKPAPDSEKDSKKDGLLARAAKAILPNSIVDSIDAFLSMPMLLFSWISISMLAQIVKGLQSINDLPTLDKVEQNVGAIMSSVRTILSEHMKDLDVDKKLISKLRKVNRIFDKVALIGSTEVNLPKNGYFESGVKTILDSIDVIYTEKITKLSEYKKLENSLKGIRTIGKIITEIGKVGSTNIITNVDWTEDGPVFKYLNGVELVVKRLSDDYIGKRKYKKSIEKLNRYADLLSIMTQMSNSHIGEFKGQTADNYEKFMGNNIKFLDKINTMDISKVKTVSKLFGKMADFSESINGNFEGLADVLNEKIAPLLEELKELMDGVGQKVEKSGADMSASISANSSNTHMTSTTMEEQVRRENPNLSTGAIRKITEQRLAEQSRQQLAGLESMFSELLEMFKSGQARVIVG